MLTEILIIGVILTSLVLMVLGILSIKEKFVRKYFLFVAILTAVFFTATLIVNAQEKPTEKKEHKMLMQQEEMEKCMDKIAADDHMSKMMLDKLLEHSKTDTAALMDMCKTMMNNTEMHKMMMNNPEMHKMMMKMMHEHGEGMMKHDMKDEKNDSSMKKGDMEHKEHH